MILGNLRQTSKRPPWSAKRLQQVQAGTLFSIHEISHHHRGDCEAIIRSLCHATYLGDDTALCRVLGRFKMYVDTWDRGLSVHLLADGYWEMWHTEAMLTLVKPGMKAVDIGANLGYFTLLMAELVGPEGSVHAFEPNRDLVMRLRDTVEINGFAGRTTVHEVALSDRTGRAQLSIPTNQPKNGYVVAAGGGRDAQRIRLRRFDQITQLADADYIKIDVEGAEEAVWKGMEGLIARGRPLTIVLEFTGGRYASAERFLDEILSGGFSLSIIDYRDGVVPISREDLLARPPAEDQLIVLRR